MLDRQRAVQYADVLFDSNVIQANDNAAEERLHELTRVLIDHPDQGNIWFHTMSVAEMVAPNDYQKRIELLKRFRSLYLRFGERVRFMRSLDDNVRADCLGLGIPSAPASVIDKDIVQSIAAGELVGLLQAGHEDWREEKRRLRTRYYDSTTKHQKSYAERADLRDLFPHALASFFSANGLEWCDDIALYLIVDGNLWTPLNAVKQRHRDYPCIWTFSLLGRLAQMTQTLTDEERKRFPEFQDVLEPHRNDFIDADIAGTGARCGMMITNDHSLIAKLNRLYDAGLIRLQGFTVYDALVAYNPPNGRVRSPA
jgi:hypothetical protein